MSEDQREICRDCRFYDVQRCKRFPPALRMTYSPSKIEWPMTEWNDWCGEFRPRVPRWGRLL